MTLSDEKKFDNLLCELLYSYWNDVEFALKIKDILIKCGFECDLQDFISVKNFECYF